MNIKSFLNEVCGQIKYKPAKQEISNELELHIRELKDDYLASGMEEKEAEEKAVSKMGNAKDIGNRLNRIHRPKLNWQLLLATVILIFFCLIVSTFKQYITHSGYIGNTIIYIVFGLIIGIIIYLFDYKQIIKYSNIIYITATLMMLLPFLGLGLTLNGKNFINILGITFSPCIIAVPLYIIAFSGYIYNLDKNNGVKIKLIKIIITSIVSLLLVGILPSTEYVILLGIIYLVITTIKIIKNNKKIMKKLALAYSTTLILILVLICGLNAFRLENNKRLENIGGQISNIQRDVLKHAKFIGEANSQTFKDEEMLISNESNYTFIYLLGKMGIIFSVVLVFTIIVTCLLLIINIKRIKEMYGKYLVIGLSTLFILESITNILTNIETNIAIDINLPFVTYGAVYFLINCFSMAIILSIYRRKNINIYDKLYEKIDY